MNFRCEKDLRDILIIRDNYSDFIRNACWEKLEREGNHKLIDLDILKHEQIIKELKERKKSSKIDTSKVNEILNKHYESFKQNNRMNNEPKWNRDWIKREIIPELPKTHKMNEHTILAIFMNHFREGKVLINV